MKQPDLLSSQTTTTLSELPPEWVGELSGLDPRSFQYRQTVETLGLLAADAGIDFDPSSLLPQPETAATIPVPSGYISAELLPRQAVIPRSQFAGIVPTLAERKEPIRADVTEYTTDAHAKVRVCDLRPKMSEQVKNNGPTDKREIARLEECLIRDLKGYAEVGHARNTVTGVPKVNYTKLNGTKAREYWMLVEDTENTDGVRTVARLADNRDSTSSQSTLYRAVFDKTYHA